MRPLDLIESSLVLKSSRSALYKWSSSGRLRAARAGNRLRFPLEELARFLKVKPDSLREAAAAAIDEAARRRQERQP